MDRMVRNQPAGSSRITISLTPWFLADIWDTDPDSTHLGYLEVLSGTPNARGVAAQKLAEAGWTVHGIRSRGTIATGGWLEAWVS